MSQIAVVDYGMSNLRSVVQALKRVAPPGVGVEIVSDAAAVRNADKVVFPGQGAAADCMRALKRCGLEQAVHEAVAAKPFLGICMGMQMLVSRSDENGGTECLDVFPGAVRSLAAEHPPEPNHKIPHIGWNQVQQSNDHPLWHGIDDESYFYFVHSYCVVPENGALVAGRTDYGSRFTSAISDGFIFAVQFHPEKSAEDGLRLLKNFAQWTVH